MFRYLQTVSGALDADVSRFGTTAGAPNPSPRQRENFIDSWLRTRIGEIFALAFNARRTPCRWCNSDANVATRSNSASRSSAAPAASAQGPSLGDTGDERVLGDSEIAVEHLLAAAPDKHVPRRWPDLGPATRTHPVEGRLHASSTAKSSDTSRTRGESRPRRFMSASASPGTPSDGVASTPPSFGEVDLGPRAVQRCERREPVETVHVAGCRGRAAQNLRRTPRGSRCPEDAPRRTDGPAPGSAPRR